MWLILNIVVHEFSYLEVTDGIVVEMLMCGRIGSALINPAIIHFGSTACRSGGRGGRRAVFVDGWRRRGFDSAPLLRFIRHSAAGRNLLLLTATAVAIELLSAAIAAARRSSAGRDLLDDPNRLFSRRRRSAAGTVGRCRHLTDSHQVIQGGINVICPTSLGRLHLGRTCWLRHTTARNALATAAGLLLITVGRWLLMLLALSIKRSSSLKLWGVHIFKTNGWRCIKF